MTLSDIVTQHFNGLAINYDEYSHKRNRYLLAQEDIIVKKLMDEISEPFVIDCGCGTGTRGMRIKERLDGARFLGYDLSEEMVKLAAQKEYESVVCASLNSPPFENVEFDAALCLFSVFSYLTSKEDRRSAIKGFYDRLKSDGLLFIDVTNRSHMGEGLSFKKSMLQIARELMYSMLNPKLSYGDVLFKSSVNGELLDGYFHTMNDSEFKKLSKNHFKIEDKFIIGYDSGALKDSESEGNFFYVCRKL
ncbi:class I SAM-dependent methyltransferase [archaeon]|nr:class I SAM-dependent methyltransferase [Nanoarchaeota archaeon]MBU4300902.1 class I SAM-dependent methyltransferase [Nanoarchaeota archaeon]MBU4451186.1 class I SAM-dependent methyltransferase [Nanoarchaeota archaeon]MCG2723249.1 class I SAM-dependent methyltransferase [archaeon]